MKDGTEEEEEARRVDEKREFSDSEDEDEDEDEDEELFDLPPEISSLLGGEDRIYESEEMLQNALDEAGVGDLRVVLVDGKPRQVIPGDQHNAFTTVYVYEFDRWCRYIWGVSSGTHKIHLQNGASRDPDISYWGYPRCTKDPELGVLLPTNLWDSPVPDVVIQFWWKNKKKYEEGAINDMMNQSLEIKCGDPSRTCPRLGYLIKVRFSKKRILANAIQKGAKTQDVVGLDIYRLTHGTTVADALDPNNHNAEHWRYFPGGPDVLITIKPQDLGITGVWALLCGAYTIKASDLFRRMHRYHSNRQSIGHTT